MAKRHAVKISSADFGAEYIRYDTKKEALEGQRRLAASAEDYRAKDGIAREVAYLGKVEIEEEN